MQPPDTPGQLFAQALASMPTQHPVCIVCQGTPSYVGTGVVDGTSYGYALCEECVHRNYVPVVIAKIRGWQLQRRRN